MSRVQRGCESSSPTWDKTSSTQVAPAATPFPGRPPRCPPLPLFLVLPLALRLPLTLAAARLLATLKAFWRHSTGPATSHASDTRPSWPARMRCAASVYTTLRGSAEDRDYMDQRGS